VGLLKKNLEVVDEFNDKLKEVRTNTSRLQEEIENMCKSENDLKAENVDPVTSKLEGYVEGFKNIMCLALSFAPSINVEKFYLKKDIIDEELVDDSKYCIQCIT